MRRPVLAIRSLAHINRFSSLRHHERPVYSSAQTMHESMRILEPLTCSGRGKRITSTVKAAWQNALRIACCFGIRFDTAVITARHLSVSCN